ncbi:hypothetical protein PA598K_04005 [Paenibacillus sp. 598K]|uniref:helix-turn-helix transcriptional regulator n=1 Tax=Paenibacillus sp. 598K TaxID=1117987 RepID=UPI000FF9F097|nr:AraC family transcriptional regulator [Paenibacillus sp. 598K]GBF75587.1 hypothetical protein PA598K_04005 [Paenibacillus sp. 598K]
MENISVSSINTKAIVMPNQYLNVEHKEPNYVLFEVLSDFQLRWNRKEEKLQCGDIVIGTKFKIFNDTKQLATLRGIVFQADSLPQASWPIVVKKAVFTVEGHTSLKSLFSFITSPSELNLELNKLLHSLLLSIKEPSLQVCSIGLGGTGKIDRRLIMINRYIRENYEQPITLQMLADLIQCNPIYLSNTYSKVFKISPIRYLQNIRMEHAKQLISSTDLSIKEIANRLGYISRSQFTELFKRYYHVTPTEYRNELCLSKYNI